MECYVLLIWIYHLYDGATNVHHIVKYVFQSRRPCRYTHACIKSEQEHHYNNYVLSLQMTAMAQIDCGVYYLYLGTCRVAQQHQMY